MGGPELTTQSASEKEGGSKDTTGRSNKVLEWVSSKAPILGAGLWTLWTFAYQELVSPTLQAKPLDIKVELISIQRRPFGQTAARTLSNSIVLNFKAHLSNSSGRDLYIPTPYWSLHGYKIQGTRSEHDLEEQLKTGVFEMNTKSIGLNQKRHLVNAGPILVDEKLRNHQEFVYPFPVLVDSKKFDYIELRVIAFGLPIEANNNKAMWLSSHRFGTDDDGDLWAISGVCAIDPYALFEKISDKSVAGEILYIVKQAAEASKDTNIKPFAADKTPKNECQLSSELPDQRAFATIQAWIGGDLNSRVLPPSATPK